MTLHKRGKALIHSLRSKGLVGSLSLLLFLVFLVPAGQAQTWSNTIETSNYLLNLPSARWRQEIESGIKRDRTYFIYEDQDPVELHIRRELVDSGVGAIDLMQQRQRWDRVSVRGYVKTAADMFEGEQEGARYAYEYVTDGKVIGKLIYFLQIDSRTIYRLEFNGSQAKLLELADEIEFIAKSFRPR